MKHALLSPTALALYGLVALVALPYALPPTLALPMAPAASVGRLRLLTPREQKTVDVLVAAPTAVGAAALVTDTDDSGARPSANGSPATTGPVPDLPATPKLPIEDPSGHALDPFYAALRKTQAREPGAITRIAYFGDSVVAADWVTSTLRRSLQARFGDAGHGYVLPANAWPGYFHQDVARFASPGWKASRVVGPFDDQGVYGLGGVSLVADGPGTFATVSTVPANKGATIGTSVSRFRVSYREAPNAGDLRLTIDGTVVDTISTRADVVKVVTRDLPVDDGAHKLEVRSMGNGPVSVLGVDLERAGPGVIVDALGIVGCRLRFLDKTRDDVFAQNLRARAPALIVLAYGANESEDGFAYPMVDYERTAREVIEKVKRASPESACLLVGPMDRADKRGDGYVTRPVIPELARIQKKLANELGCGYFDTFRAMGGYGSMGVWVQRGLGGKDLVHPTNEGAAVIAGWLESALLAGLSERTQRVP